MVKAKSVTATVAHKMHMVIVVVAGLTFLLAQCIADGVVGRGYGVDDAFFHKSLQCTVDGHPIKLVAGKLFNIAMGKRTVRMVKKFQNPFSAVSHA